MHWHPLPLEYVFKNSVLYINHVFSLQLILISLKIIYSSLQLKPIKTPSLKLSNHIPSWFILQYHEGCKTQQIRMTRHSSEWQSETRARYPAIKASSELPFWKTMVQQLMWLIETLGWPWMATFPHDKRRLQRWDCVTSTGAWLHLSA